MAPPVLVLVGAVILSLLGFGAAFAIESIFGVPREMTYDTPLDLLNLGGHVIAGGLESLDGWSKSKNFTQIALLACGAGAAITALWLLYRAVAVHGRKQNDDRSYRPNRKIPGAIAVVRFGRWLFKEKWCLIPGLIISAIPWLCIYFMGFVLILFAGIPAIGYGIANDYLHRWIVDAEYCAPVSSREERLRIKASDVASRRKPSEDARLTPCLSLWKDGVLIGEGRHVASTDKYIILFDPVTGGVNLEPANGVTIRLKGMSASELYQLIDRDDTED